MKIKYYFGENKFKFGIIECSSDITVGDLLELIHTTPQHPSEGHDENLEEESEKYSKDDVYLHDIKKIYLKDKELNHKDTIKKYSVDLKKCFIFLSDGTYPGPEYELKDIRINFTDYEIEENEKLNAPYFNAIDKKTNKKVFVHLNDDPNKNIPIYVFDSIRGFNLVRKLKMHGLLKPIGYGYILNSEELTNVKIIKVDNGLRNPSNYLGQGSTFVYEYIKNEPVGILNEEYLKTKGQNKDKMNPTIRSKIIFGVAAIMKKLHHKGVVHRNLKPSIIFLDEKNEPKIGGFEYIKIFNENMDNTFGIGSYQYMAPELYMDEYENYNNSIDVFAYGMTLYSMFSFKKDMDMQARSYQQLLRKIGTGLRPSRTEIIPDHYWELINRCWENDPSKRPTFVEIVEILKDDKYALNEFGMETNLKDLHEYQKRLENDTKKHNHKKSSKSPEQYNQILKENEDLRIKIENYKKSILEHSKEDEQKDINFFDEDDEKFFKYLKKIGEGSTSITYKLIDTRTNRIMCKKVFKDKQDKGYNIKDLQNALKEFQILYSINHPCICCAFAINTADPLHDSKIKSDKKITTVSILLEYIEYDIKDVLKTINNTFKTRIIVEIAHAMNFLHQNGIIHRDLKIENIRLNAVFNAKIIDFGLVKIFESLSNDYSFVSDSLTKGVGTLSYMSPEMLNEEDYDYKTDVYSFGVVVYFLFVGDLPKLSMKDKMIGKKIDLPIASSSISQCCIDLIEKCLSIDQNERPTFREVLTYIRNHSYLLAPDVDYLIILHRDNELALFEN